MFKQAQQWYKNVLALPETNLILFSFLLNFAYEVGQSPYYDFYEQTTFTTKIDYLFHCTRGDVVFSLISWWLVALILRSRTWLLHLTWKPALLFTCFGLLITLVTEIYRVNVLQLYGIPVLAVPGIGISWLVILQWVALPTPILLLARRQMLGYESNHQR